MTTGYGRAGLSAPAGRIQQPASLVDLGAQALRRMIIEGELAPGARVVENQLTQTLGISRPPLREAMRLLEREGLIQQVPRKGATVIPLTLHDVYEIVTLRQELERLAVELAIPVRDRERLVRCHRALDAMDLDAAAEDPVALAEDAFEFHLSVVGLSGHRRLEDTFRSLQLQMLLCIGLNRRARSKRLETMAQDVDRHRTLLDVIESGDLAQVLHQMSHHGDLSFLHDLDENLADGSDEARTWLQGILDAGEQP